MDLPRSADIFRGVDPDTADDPEELLTQSVVRRSATSEPCSPLRGLHCSRVGKRLEWGRGARGGGFLHKEASR